MACGFYQVLIIFFSPINQAEKFCEVILTWGTIFTNAPYWDNHWKEGDIQMQIRIQPKCHRPPWLLAYTSTFSKTEEIITYQNQQGDQL